MEFDFVTDKNFQEILKRDYLELKKCLEAKAFKSILILAGSIVEALLSDYFTENLPPGYSKEDILKLTLSKLLDIAESEKLISSNDKNLAIVIKNYRNLIHPGVEIRKGEQFDVETIAIASSVLDLLIKRIQSKYGEKFPTNAEEIVYKLDEDWTFHSVYGLAILKLNTNEKNKLFDEFLEIEDDLKSKVDNFKDDDVEVIEYTEIYTVKHFVNELKPLLRQEFILNKLKALEELILKGEALDVFVYYNLLHEEIILLPKETQEMIAIYILSMFSSIQDNSSELSDEKTYSTIGKYIHTERGLSQIKALMEYSLVNLDIRDYEYQFNVLEQIINSLSDSHRKEIEAHVQKFINPRGGAYIPEDYLPFVKEFINRNLLDLKIG